MMETTLQNGIPETVSIGEHTAEWELVSHTSDEVHYATEDGELSVYAMGMDSDFEEIHVTLQDNREADIAHAVRGETIVENSPEAVAEQALPELTAQL